MDSYMRQDLTCGGSSRLNEYAHLSADEYALLEAFAGKHMLKIQAARNGRPFILLDSHAKLDMLECIPFLDIRHYGPECVVYFSRVVSFHDTAFNETQLELWDTHLIGIKPCRTHI